MRVLVLASSKGGVGKSSIASSLAVGLAKFRKVVLVDIDNSHGSTTNLGIRGHDPRNDQGEGLAKALLLGHEIPTQPARWVAPWDAELVLERTNLRVAVGGGAICDVSDALVSGGLDTETALASVRGLDADIVIIDCPPGDRRLQAASLAVADQVLVPVEYDMNSVLGLVDLVKVVVTAKRTNPGLDLAGVVLYRLAAGAPAQRREAREHMEQALNGAARVFDTIIRSSVEYGRAQNYGLVPAEYAECLRITEGFSAAKAVSGLTWDFQNLLDEVMSTWA
jgi:chromosome partitioning protein